MKRLTAFVIVILIGWNIILTITYYQVKTDVKTPSVKENSEKNVKQESVRISSDVTKLVEQSENKVVTVTAKARGKSVGSGSGAIYKADGKTAYIITNNHVVAAADEVIVTFANGKNQKVTIVGKDELTDLASLKVKIDFKTDVFQMGDSSLVKKGEYVIAMGSPLGIEYQGSVSGGLISGVNRRMELDIDNNGIADWDVNVLQTDAAINPGNSGGPLINMAGQLIGINSMKISDESVEGFGFALPINEVLPIISQLEKDGKVVRPILGISVQPIAQLSVMDRAYLNIPSNVKNGLLIVKVAANTPAAKAKIEEGDILLKFDDKELNDFKQFRQLLYSKKVGDEVRITIEREKKEIAKTITLT